FIALILSLHDLLQILRLREHRIVFTDDVPDGQDITDLVSKVRNAIAHPSSPENLLDKDSHLKFLFNAIYGQGSPIVLPGAEAFKSDYSDDVAFFFGEHRLYLQRHLWRLLNEAINEYRSMYPDDAKRFLRTLEMIRY